MKKSLYFLVVTLILTSCQLEEIPSADIPGPTIASFDPTSGPSETRITIYGTNFSTTPEDNIVRFNNSQGTVISATPTTLEVEVPSNATTGLISVSIGDNSTESNDHFKVALRSVKTLLDNAVLSSLNVSNDQTYGFEFSSAVDGLITELGTKFPSSGEYQVSIWDPDPNVEFPINGGGDEIIQSQNGTWSYDAITPLAVKAGQIYIVSVLVKSGIDRYGTEMAPPLKNDHITIHGYRFASFSNKPSSTGSTSIVGLVDFTFVED